VINGGLFDTLTAARVDGCGVVEGVFATEIAACLALD
jgi:hypothetical protein